MERFKTKALEAWKSYKNSASAEIVTGSNCIENAHQVFTHRRPVVTTGDSF